MGIQIAQKTFETLPAGTVVAQFADFTEEMSRKYEKPQLRVKWDIVEPAPLAGKTLVGWCGASFTPKSKLYAWTRAAFGGRDIPTTWTFDSDKLLGRKVVIVIGVGEGESGKLYNKILDVMPYSKPTTPTTPVAPAVTATQPTQQPASLNDDDEWQKVLDDEQAALAEPDLF